MSAEEKKAQQTKDKERKRKKRNDEIERKISAKKIKEVTNNKPLTDISLNQKSPQKNSFENMDIHFNHTTLNYPPKCEWLLNNEGTAWVWHGECGICPMKFTRNLPGSASRFEAWQDLKVHKILNHWHELDEISKNEAKDARVAILDGKTVKFSIPLNFFEKNQPEVDNLPDSIKNIKKYYVTMDEYNLLMGPSPSRIYLTDRCIHIDEKILTSATKYFSEKKISCGENVLCEKSSNLLKEFMMSSGKFLYSQNIQEFREQCFTKLIDPLFSLAKLNSRDKYEAEKKFELLVSEWKKIRLYQPGLSTEIVKDRIIIDCYKWILEI